MQIPIAVQPVAGNGYCARGGEPFGLTAHGATPDEAVQNLRTLIQREIDAGVQVVLLEVPVTTHPLAQFAGMFKDDPVFVEVIDIMAENRRKEDQAADAP